MLREQARKRLGQEGQERVSGFPSGDHRLLWPGRPAGLQSDGRHRHGQGPGTSRTEAMVLGAGRRPRGSGRRGGDPGADRRVRGPVRGDGRPHHRLPARGGDRLQGPDLPPVSLLGGAGPMDRGAHPVRRLPALGQRLRRRRSSPRSARKTTRSTRPASPLWRHGGDRTNTGMRVLTAGSGDANADDRRSRQLPSSQRILLPPGRPREAACSHATRRSWHGFLVCSARSMPGRGRLRRWRLTAL